MDSFLLMENKRNTKNEKYFSFIIHNFWTLAASKCHFILICIREFPYPHLKHKTANRNKTAPWNRNYAAAVDKWREKQRSQRSSLYLPGKFLWWKAASGQAAGGGAGVLTDIHGVPLKSWRPLSQGRGPRDMLGYKSTHEIKKVHDELSRRI